MTTETSPSLSLKNFKFLSPHLPKLEGDLRSLLYEIDQLIEKKKANWEKDLKSVEIKFSEKLNSNELKNSDVRNPHLPAASRSIHSNQVYQRLVNADHLNKHKPADSGHKNNDSMKNSCEKQNSVENFSSYEKQKKFERENRLLLSELNNLKETSHTKTEVLASQLKNEKNSNVRLKERCIELETRLNVCAADLEKERAVQRNLQSAMHSRQSELDTLLQKTNFTVESQAKELTLVKELLESKRAELLQISSELSSRNSCFLATKEIVSRLERIVSKHLSLLVSNNEPFVANAKSFSNVPLPDKETESDDIVGKLSKLESDLFRSGGYLKVKVKEISRLKSACNVAASTIKRLNEAKANAIQQATSLRQGTQDAVVRLEYLHESVEKWRKVMKAKLMETERRLCLLTKSVQQIRLSRPRTVIGSGQCSVSVQQDFVKSSVPSQTDGEFTAPPDYWPGSKVQLLRNDWLASVQKLQKRIDALTAERAELLAQLKHQATRAEELQKDNLALTDLLTGAENFNRTRISCASCVQDEESRNLQSASHSSLSPTPLRVDLKHISRKGILQTGSSACSHPAFADQIPGSASLPVCLGTAFTSTPKRFDPSSPPAPSDKVDCRGDSQTPSLSHSPELAKDRPDSATVGQILSPVEYGEFVLSTDHGRRPVFCAHKACPTIKGIQPTSCQSDLDNPTYGKSVDVVQSKQPIVRFAENTPIEHRKQRVSFSSSHEIRQVDKNNSAYDGLNDFVMSPRDSSLFLEDPLYTGTDSVRPVDGLQEVSDDDEEDASVYCLAAKFLADEQQHSLQLEQQIDMHLDELKRQIGL